MKTSHLIALTLVLLVASCSSKESISICTDEVYYSIDLSGDRIVPRSYLDKSSGRELLSPGDAPYFEFMTSRGLLRSDMPIWRYSGMEQKALSNGGTQVSTYFKGKGNAEGLSIVLEHQHFPGSALIRERLLIRSDTTHQFSFRDEEGHKVFRYAGYHLNSPISSCTEWRMATYQEENHLFRADSLEHPDCSNLRVKGPFAAMVSGDEWVVTSYEHASQDDGIWRTTKCGTGLWSSTRGEAVRTVTPDDYWFVSTCLNGSSICQSLIRGAYWDGEPIPSQYYYETPWATINAMPLNEDYTRAIRHYICEQITERPITRGPRFYYNTWGMQKAAAETEGLRASFNQERISREIEYAAELGVECFVFDDGWQKSIGVWEVDSIKTPDIGALIDQVKSRGMVPGAWISLVSLDSLSTRAAEHSDWIVRDADGVPAKAQYKQNAMDLVSDYYYAIKGDLIRLIDMGFRFFKFDAIDSFHSAQAGLWHGDESVPREERIARYDYMLPFVVTRLMRELREYCPDVVVEIDLTEPERALIGLMPLQEGKFFWFNNGASRYGDYSTFRTKSARNVINLNSTIIPPEVITYASYPHDVCGAQEYNINSSLLCGHGFWGDLSLMTPAQRLLVHEQVTMAENVLPYLEDQTLHHSGRVGDSPEIYWCTNDELSYGEIIAYSGRPLNHHFELPIQRPDRVAAVLNHPYTLRDGVLTLDLSFERADDSCSAFVLANKGRDFTITSCDGVLNSIDLEPGVARVYTSGDGHLKYTSRSGESKTIDFKNGETLTIAYE